MTLVADSIISEEREVSFYYNDSGNNMCQAIGSSFLLFIVKKSIYDDLKVYQNDQLLFEGDISH